ncbi:MULTISPECIES: GyrI-like domain-containing protein [Bacillaceae]|uniref:GyrI-like domain-containing protein n=1 Tax=Evansella alkalicola TaxID=745819 RepID=A0ABS6JYA5_9BACI|nr:MULTISPECIES: GyrI-like domain-containing protein [Bacillaceae]MBU9723370.1 GyrI-like domain-containing protein [Bacillus alkalicola]
MTKYRVLTKPAYRAVGMKWEGSWAEVSGLKEVIHQMEKRVEELDGAVEATIQLGLSYHTRKDGFTHYSAFEVTKDQHVPTGMEEINIPEMMYLVTTHEKGENIGQTYVDITNYLKNSDYLPYSDETVPYDFLPIKHERYPLDRNKEDPHFEILIPIVKK